MQMNPIMIQAAASHLGKTETRRAADTVSAPSNFGDVLRSVSDRGRDLDPIFEQAEKTYGVPQELLRAIAFHESGFQTDAVSSAGAMGLMQLMPATAETMGVRDPFDAKENIFGGAKLLSQLFDKYQGDLKLTLAAYGAGSGAVAKYGGVPPYEETRGFVRDILSAMDGSDWNGFPSLSRQYAAFDDFTEDDYLDLLRYVKILGASAWGIPSDEDDEDEDTAFPLMGSSFYGLRL